MPSAAVESQHSPARRARGASLSVAFFVAPLLVAGVFGAFLVGRAAHAKATSQRAVPLPPMPTLLQQQSAVLPNPLSADAAQRYHSIFAPLSRRARRASVQAAVMHRVTLLVCAC